ncbi:MAG TPA: hypothetical protein VKH44_08985, partial [Pirellulaceae bacterium]|nr:hypothetical protein [Pirellulaceae bacterium]
MNAPHISTAERPEAINGPDTPAGALRADVMISCGVLSRGIRAVADFAGNMTLAGIMRFHPW